MENEAGGPWVASGQHQGAGPFLPLPRKAGHCVCSARTSLSPRRACLCPLALSLGIAWTSICRPIAMDKVTLGVYVPHDQQTLFAAFPLVNIFFPKTIVFFVELKTFTLLSTYLSL